MSAIQITFDIKVPIIPVLFEHSITLRSNCIYNIVYILFFYFCYIVSLQNCGNIRVHIFVYILTNMCK